MHLFSVDIKPDQSSEIHLSVCDRIHYKLRYKIDHTLYNLQDSALRELLIRVTQKIP